MQCSLTRTILFGYMSSVLISWAYANLLNLSFLLNKSSLTRFQVLWESFIEKIIKPDIKNRWILSKYQSVGTQKLDNVSQTFLTRAFERAIEIFLLEIKCIWMISRDLDILVLVLLKSWRVAAPERKLIDLNLDRLWSCSIAKTQLAKDCFGDRIWQKSFPHPRVSDLIYLKSHD